MRKSLKVVGRVGVEPTTKRLRGTCPHHEMPMFHVEHEACPLRVAPPCSIPLPTRGGSLRGSTVALTFQRVHIIRTVPELDTVYARRWRVSVSAVREARIGKSWREHPTPVDNKPRAHRGNWENL
jgi:hypothetical protein